MHFTRGGRRVCCELSLTCLNEGPGLGLWQERTVAHSLTLIHWIVRERLTSLMVPSIAGLRGRSDSRARLRLRALWRILLAPRLYYIVHQVPLGISIAVAIVLGNVHSLLIFLEKLLTGLVERLLTSICGHF